LWFWLLRVRVPLATPFFSVRGEKFLPFDFGLRLFTSHFSPITLISCL
jgi:hypothetical protein